MKSTSTSPRVPLGSAFITAGEILDEEFLKPMGLSQSALADRMGVHRKRISEIVRGKRAISAETAILLGEAFGTSARFWMNLQTSHDLAVAMMKRDQAAGSSRIRPALKNSGNHLSLSFPSHRDFALREYFSSDRGVFRVSEPFPQTKGPPTSPDGRVCLL